MNKKLLLSLTTPLPSPPPPPPRASKLRGQVWISLYLLLKLVYLNGKSLAWEESVQLESTLLNLYICFEDKIKSLQCFIFNLRAIFISSKQSKEDSLFSSSWLFAIRHTWLYIVTEESRLGRNSRYYTNETLIDCLINKEAFHVSSPFLYVQKFTLITYRLLLWESMKQK